MSALSVTLGASLSDSVSVTLTEALSATLSERSASIERIRSEVAAYAYRLHLHLHLGRGLPEGWFWFGGISSSESAAPRLTRCSSTGWPGPILDVRARLASAGSGGRTLGARRSGRYHGDRHGGATPVRSDALGPESRRSSHGSTSQKSRADRYRVDPEISLTCDSYGDSVQSLIGWPIFSRHIDPKAECSLHCASGGL
jgi:hypothetical protein